MRKRTEVIEEKLDGKMNDYRNTCHLVKEERATVIDSELSLDYIKEAQTILQHVAQAIQQEAHSKIASIVSLCLEGIFDDPYEFRIAFERKRGKTEAVLEFVKNGVTLTDPKNEIGGGVIDVASFALRLACLMLTRPQLRRILILDEPFRNIRGSENKEKVRDLIVKLSKEMNIQFILNIDIDAYPEFSLGKLVEVS